MGAGLHPAVRVMHVAHSLQPGGMEFGVVKLVNGLLLAPGSPREMAAALGRLLGDEAARRTMGAAGRHRVEAEFALSTMVTTSWPR